MIGGRRLDLSLVFVGAWSLISLGVARRFGTYTPTAIAMVSAGMALLTFGLLQLKGSGVAPPSRAALVLGAAVALAGAQLYPAGQHSKGPAEAWAHGLLLAAAVVLLVLVLTGSARRSLGAAVGVLVAGAGIAGIVSSPRPSIDDWHLMQGAARAVLHLQNIYGRTWPGSAGHTFPYLPGAAIGVAPFWAVFGDVRYGLLAALALASLAVAGLGSRVSRAVLIASGLIVLAPRVLYGIEQSWPEPLLLGLLAATVWAAETGRRGLAVVFLAAALATKQHALIVLPLAALWPAFGWRRAFTALGVAAVIVGAWYLVWPRAFVQGAITYNLRLHPRIDSLSVFTTATKAGWTPSFVLVPLLMIGALAVAIWKVPRTTPGFVFGSAWLLGMFNLLNKQSFFNEWSLVIGLIMVGVATMTRTDSAIEEPGRLGAPGVLSRDR